MVMPACCLVINFVKLLLLMKKLHLVALSLIVSACNSASSSKTYTMEGKQGYTINCSGQDKDWGLCYQKAGSLCEDKGYDILDATGESGIVTDVKSSAAVSTTKTMTTHNRIMVIQCREKEEEKNTTSPKGLFGLMGY